VHQDLIVQKILDRKHHEFLNTVFPNFNKNQEVVPRGKCFTATMAQPSEGLLELLA